MSTITNIPWTLSDGVLSVKLQPGYAVTLDESHPNFAAALSALRAKEYDLIPDLVSIARQITKLGAGLVSVCGGEVHYRGNPIANSLTDRILKMLSEGRKDIMPLVNFLENTMLNPNREAVDRLFAFLEASKLPLTPDGCFLAYRGVNADFSAKHTGMWDDQGKFHEDKSYDNSPGKICKMPRKECDEDSKSCCSRGLHFASLPYLGPVGGWAGGSDNIIIIKINPRDVVAVPYSYDTTKGRCCRFEVLRVWQTTDQAKDLTRDAWEVSTVAESEEVTSPAIRAMLNLARIEEALEGFELKPVNEVQEEELAKRRAEAATYSASDESDSEYCEDCGELHEDCYCGEGGDSDEDFCDECGELHDDCECGCDFVDESPSVPSSIPGILDESEDIDPVIILNGPQPKDEKDRKKLIAELYKLAVRTNGPAFAFQKDDKKRQGDLKVTPQGRVLMFDSKTNRWAAWYDINLSGL